MENNELLKVNQDGVVVEGTITESFVDKLTATNSSTYTSIDISRLSLKEKAVVTNAMANPKNRLRDFIGKTIRVVDIIAHEVPVIDERTGETMNAPRIILIDDKQEAYTCVSKGVFNVLKTNIFVNIGLPPYNKANYADLSKDGLPLEVTQINKNTYQILTLELDTEKI